MNRLARNSSSVAVNDVDDSSTFDEVLVSVSARFAGLAADQIDEAIASAQAAICRSLCIERGSVWQVLPLSPTAIVLTHIHGARVPEPIPAGSDFRERYPWMTQTLSQGRTIVAGRLSDLPSEAAFDIEALQRAGFKSILAIPMQGLNGELAGVLAFGTIRHNTDWSTRIVARCRLVAQLFSGALSRMRLEQALRDSESRFRAVVENSNEAVYFVSRDGTLLYRSPNASRLTGYSNDERIGKSAFATVYPEDLERVKAWWEAAVADPQTLHLLEFRITQKSGDGWRWMESSVRNLLENPNVKAMVVSSRDITARKNTESILRRYEMLVSHTRDIVLFSHFPDGRILDGNAAALTAYGYSIDELTSLTLDQIRAPNTVADLAQRMEATFSPRGIRFETQHRRKDGSIFPVEITAVGITIAGERIVMGCSRDMTERHHADELLRQQQNKLAHLSRVTSVGEMASGLAHELNQPLSAMLNYAASCSSMIHRNDPPLNQLRSVVLKLAHEARRAGEIANRWRSFIRDQALEKTKLDLAAVIHEGLSMLSHDFNRRGFKLVENFDSAIPQVELDSVLIQQVVVNLTLNAMDAMAENSPDRRILKVRTFQSDPSQIRVEFEDRGPGVDESLQKAIFKSFTTTKPHGLGLGLAISRSIIESHGGHLEFCNNKMGGATFWFVIPIEA